MMAHSWRGVGSTSNRARKGWKRKRRVDQLRKAEKEMRGEAELELESRGEEDGFGDDDGLGEEALVGDELLELGELANGSDCESCWRCCCMDFSSSCHQRNCCSCNISRISTSSKLSNVKCFTYSIPVRRKSAPSQKDHMPSLSTSKISNTTNRSEQENKSEIHQSSIIEALLHTIAHWFYTYISSCASSVHGYISIYQWQSPGSWWVHLDRNRRRWNIICVWHVVGSDDGRRVERSIDKRRDN